MSSKTLQRKPTNKKGMYQKKGTTAAGGLKKKTQQKAIDFKEDSSETDDSSLDEKYLEELDEESDDDTDTESEDLSQEFSDEDKLMEYYENKLREHSIVGNVDLDESTGSSDEEELKSLAEEALRARKISSKRDLARILRPPSTPAIVTLRSTTDFGASRKDFKNFKPMGGRPNGIASGDAKTPTIEKNSIKSVQRKTPLKGTKPLARAKKLVSSKKRASVHSSVIPSHSSSEGESRPRQRLRDKHHSGAPLTGFRVVSDLKKTSGNDGADRATQMTASKKSRATSNNGNSTLKENHVIPFEDIQGSRKVIDYLSKMREVEQSIEDINGRLKKWGETESHESEILTSTKALILDQVGKQGRKNRIFARPNYSKGSMGIDGEKSSSGSESSETRFKNDAVDRILRAAVGGRP